ncbi:MAG: Omp28-related outer membrane protein [Bacteroides sp.]|nr:Omp28-related outer membrane protein [Bacteroides sp.]
MKRLLLAMLLILTAIGLNAAVTATLDPEPGTEFETLPASISMVLSEPMNGVPPTVLAKCNDKEVNLVVVRTSDYAHYTIWLNYYVSNSAELMEEIEKTGEFSLEVTLCDGTVLDPFLYKYVVPEPEVTATFDVVTGSVFAGLPTSIYFSLSEAVTDDSPKLLLNDEHELTCYGNNGSSEEFYCLLSDVDSSVADEIMEAGEFTLCPVLEDGTRLDAVKYYVVSQEISWTAAASNVPGSTFGSMPETMKFTLTDELPADGVYTAGVLASAGMPEDFEGWTEELECTVEGTEVTFNMTELSAQTISAIESAKGFIIGIALANTQISDGFKYIVRKGTVTLGYCTDDFAQTFESLGANGAGTTIGASIRIPAAKLQSMKGCEIKKIRIGIGNGLERVYGWIRPSLSQPVHVMKKLEDTSEGWHEIEFDKPYIITGDEIYIGYSAYQPSDIKAVRAGGSDHPDACWLGIKDVWEDMSEKGYGSLYIQAFTEAVLPESDLGVDNVRADKQYYKNGENINVDFVVFNSGLNPVNNYTISYTVDDEETVTKTVTDELAPDMRAEHQFVIPVENLEDGLHTLTVSCALNDDDRADEVEDNDATVLTIPVYSKSYDRTVLLENFTTLRCVNCPNGHASINNAIKDRDNVAVVAHHVGFGTDEFTIPESEAYLDFDVIGAPSLMLDRQIVNGTVPPVTIGFTNTVMGGEIISGYIETVQAIPAFVSVELDNTYDAESRKLTISMKGEKNAIFSELFKESNYTVFLTEDDITAQAPQTGATGSYIHDHVLRAVLTPAFGTSVDWNGDEYEVSAEYEIPAEWKPWNMNVVAMVNRPFDASNLGNCQILNCAAIKVNAEDPNVSVPTISEETIRVINGAFAAEGASEINVYTTDGKRMANSNLMPGIYILQIVDASGTQHSIKKQIR